MAYIDDVNNILQIQPNGMPAVVRLSQNENGRNLYFTLSGNESAIPSTVTVTISGTKPDGNVYSGTGSITNNVILIEETVQMTAVAGTWDAKIQIISGGNTIATGRIRFVIDADTVEPGSVPSESELNGLVAQAQQYAEDARSAAYGSPLTASTASAMIDKTRVYVYTGSESGYTNGHWYYWNGSAWADGGAYNSTGVQTDTTLSVSGVPADAKATGDAIAAEATARAAADTAINGEITQLKEDLNVLNDCALNGDEYKLNPTWKSGTTVYYDVGEPLNVFLDSNARKRTDVIYAPIGTKVTVKATGIYNIRVLNAGTDNVITEVSGYVDSYDFVSDGEYVVLVRNKNNPSADISAIDPNDYVTVKLDTQFNKLQDEIDSIGIQKIIPNTQSVPTTSADYYALWEDLVTDGYCTKTQIATVDSKPIYKYIISKDKDTLSGDGLTVVSDGSYYKKPKISMISGVHGDEKGSPLFLYEFINRMCRNKAYGKYIGMYDFHIIPLVNPTGYDLGKRENYQNININRDATSNPTTVEGQALKAHFDSNDWACCIDFHQMSHGHGTSGFTYSCGYMALFNGADTTTKEKFCKLFTEVGYEIESLMEAYTAKTTHMQMFQMWNWTENYNNWTNYPVNVVHKTDASFIIETAQTWYYYSGSGIDLNPIALIGGNTFTDGLVKKLLENV